MCGTESKLTTVCVSMVMKETVIQCNSLAHRYFCNSFLTTMELYRSEEDISGSDTHTILVSRCIHCWFESEHEI